MFVYVGCSRSQSSIISGLQIQSLKDTTGEDAVIVTEGYDHTRWRIVKIRTHFYSITRAHSTSDLASDVSDGKVDWARHFDMGVNYSARINRTGYTLVVCGELPPENARLIAPDGAITVWPSFLPRTVL